MLIVLHQVVQLFLLNEASTRLETVSAMRLLSFRTDRLVLHLQEHWRQLRRLVDPPQIEAVADL